MFGSVVLAVAMLTSNSSPAVSSGTPEDVIAFEQAYTQTQAAFESNNTAETKAKFVDATVAYATAVMTSPNISAREKYPQALRLYRDAQKLDPENADAANNIAMIEGIYESMGRPIPE